MIRTALLLALLGASQAALAAGFDCDRPENACVCNHMACTDACKAGANFATHSGPASTDWSSFRQAMRCAGTCERTFDACQRKQARKHRT